MFHQSAIVFYILLSSVNPAVSQLEELYVRGFRLSNLTIDGVTEIEKNGILRLTNDSMRVKGHAFYPSPFRLKNSTTGKALSFSTSFVFATVPEYAKLGGHGFAFAVTPSPLPVSSLPSQYLGLLNSSDIGNFSNHLFAVEFDTVQDFEFDDINDNHVGININSLVSNKSVAASYYLENSTLAPLSLKSGKKIQSWIDYDSEMKLLEVRLAASSIRPFYPILSYEVDLSPILKEFMYVGFSGSTGLLASSHYIFGWSFNMNGVAKSLSLPSLPSLPGPKKDPTGMIIGFTVATTTLVFIVVSLVVYMSVKIKNADVIETWELQVGPHRFPYKELKNATRGFSHKNLLGFGGFGKVYRGTLLSTNSQVAVKRVSHESKQGLKEFVSEIETIGRLRHKNLVRLLGWCRRRGDLLLVYEYMPNGSLDKYLFDDPNTVLSWKQRYKIIKDVAFGLLYLHEEWEQTVIHRDIKAANVLLDGELNGRVGDFGLAKLYEHGANPSTTRVVGTLGYLAPELTRTGKPTTSSDVFAFGAVLLEVACGRRPVEPKASPEELILTDFVWDKWGKGEFMDVMDARLEGDFDKHEVTIVVKLGLLCLNNQPEARPSMRQVVRFLEGEIPLPEVIAAPDSYDGKLGSHGAPRDERRVEFEDFVNSFETSFYVEKGSQASSAVDLGIKDVEFGETTPMPLPFKTECR